MIRPPFPSGQTTSDIAGEEADRGRLSETKANGGCHAG